MNGSGYAMIFSMAFRNLSRHRIKTIITATAIAVSVALYIFADSWMKGINIESRRNIVIYEMGAAKIQTVPYFNKKDDLPMYENFNNWEEISRVLKEKGYNSAPRFAFTGTIYSKSGSAPMLCNAIDVEREKELLRYPDFIDAGNFPAPGTPTIALGIQLAEKLHVGIPQRPDMDEYTNEIMGAAVNDGEKDFISSMYVPYTGEEEKKLFAPQDDYLEEQQGMALKKDATRDELNRLWKILSATGRMDIRIATTIDIKALPERIMDKKFTRDLLPLFSKKEQEMIRSVYEKDPVLNDYMLIESDTEMQEKVLSLLLEAGYTGAVRHVKQLIDAVVVGVINSPNPKLNSNIGFIPLNALQDERGLMLQGRITELLIRAADAHDSKLPGKKESPQTIFSALEKSSVTDRFSEGTQNPLGVFSWQEYAKDFIAAYNGDNVSTRVMVFFLFLLSFIGIANTMLMAILERTREIGMLRALGMTDRQLLASYVTEAALVGLIGSSIGVIIGCLINIPMVNSGIDYSEMTNVMSGDIGYRIAAQFRSIWSLTTIIGSFLFAIVLSGCMAILPTLRALKKPVTETLRFE